MNNLTNLYSNLAGAAIFRNAENKILVCKSSYSNNILGIPIIKVRQNVTGEVPTGKATVADISFQLIETMRKEFGTDSQILDYYETTRIPYIHQGNRVLGNCVCYDFIDAGDYKGKPTIVAEPTGTYTEVQYLTVAQIESLAAQNKFDTNSLYFVIRAKERYSL